MIFFAYMKSSMLSYSYRIHFKLLCLWKDMCSQEVGLFLFSSSQIQMDIY
jgi:hypothetical protein